MLFTSRQTKCERVEEFEAQETSEIGIDMFQNCTGCHSSKIEQSSTVGDSFTSFLSLEVTMKGQMSHIHAYLTTASKVPSPCLQLHRHGFSLMHGDLR